MTLSVSLSMTGDQHDELKTMLFPGDEKEAAVILLCGRRDGIHRQRMTVQKIILIPYEVCTVRSATRVTWPTEYIADLLDLAEQENLSVIKVHSHPGGYADFSEIDDIGDREFLPGVRGWIEADIPHGSAVMLPNGEMFGRYLHRNGSFEPIMCINVVGDDLHYWYADAGSVSMPSFVASHKQAFGEGTTERLQRISVAVIGASGTGSPTIEALMRLGVGEIVSVDDDRMEDRNINRIFNSTVEDAANARHKVHVIEDAVNRTGLGTHLVAIEENLWNPGVIRRVAECDVVFGCMDSIDGRFLLNLLATYYMLPYFDIGVRLDAVPEGSEVGRIREICGTVHYLQPGKSSLLSRGMFTLKQVADAGIRRKDPKAFQDQVDAGYIKGVIEQKPAVISVNMFAASLMVNEFLARIHPYREEPNSQYASTEFSLASMEFYPEQEEGVCEVLGHSTGLGDRIPLLGLPELAERRES